jgi:hypothetical protein
VKNISLPNEHWQAQQKPAWAKLARSEAPDKEVEASAQEMITRREWLLSPQKAVFQKGYPDQSPVQKPVHNLAAKLNVTPAASATGNALNAQAEHYDAEAALAKNVRGSRLGGL